MIGDVRCIRAIASQYKGTGTSLEVVNSDSSAYSLFRANMTNTAQSHHWITYGTPNPVEKLTLTNNGRLGIGTTTPQCKLDIHGTATLTNNGRLGIGTTTPKCKLDIHGTTVGHITVNSTHGGTKVEFSRVARFHSTLYNMYVAVNASSGGSFVGWALYVGYAINFQSDSRIKTDIQELNDSEALEKFRKLKPCKYKYKETLLSGRPTNEVYGYIAQEVADVLPHAVTKGDIKGTHQGHIPNIMSICDISNTTITFKNSLDTSVVTEEGGYLCSDASNNIPLKTINDLEKNAEGIYHPLIFYDKNNKLYECKITEVIDESTFIVDDLPVENESMIDGNQLLLYGQKPDDFHRLNKDVIFTVTAAALQEVDRIQQQQQTKIEELEARISALETK